MAVFLLYFLTRMKENRLKKNSILLVSEILKLFVNILTPNEKYSLSVKASVSRNQFKCNYLEIEKYFLNFLLDIRNLHRILNALFNATNSNAIIQKSKKIF